MITAAHIVRVPAPAAPGYGKVYSCFVRGSGSVWVHLSTILRVLVSFRFTEVKLDGSGSVRFTKMKQFIRVYGSGSGSVRHPALFIDRHSVRVAS